MAEVVDYIYAIAGACAFALGGLGGLIMSLSLRHTRIARGFVIASAFPVFLMAIIFGWTNQSPYALPIAGLSAFIIGMIYSVGIAVLNDHLDAENAPEERHS